MGWPEVVRNGWVVAVVALLAALAQSTFSQASTHLVAMEGIHVKAALQAMVYRKALRLSTRAPTSSEQHLHHQHQQNGPPKAVTSTMERRGAGHHLRTGTLKVLYRVTR